MKQRATASPQRTVRRYSARAAAPKGGARGQQWPWFRGCFFYTLSCVRGRSPRRSAVCPRGDCFARRPTPWGFPDQRRHCRNGHVLRRIMREFSARTLDFFVLLAGQVQNGPYPLLSFWSIDALWGRQIPFHLCRAFSLVRLFAYYRRYRCRRASRFWAWSALWFWSLLAATIRTISLLSTPSRSALNPPKRANTSTFAGRALRSALTALFPARLGAC